MTEPRLIPPRVSPRDYEAGYTAAVADVIEHGLEVARQEVRNMLAVRGPAPPAMRALLDDITERVDRATFHGWPRASSPPDPAKRPPGLPPRP